MLSDIARNMGVYDTHITRRLLHDAFKTYLNVESTSMLSDSKMKSYLEAVDMLCSRERGFAVIKPNEQFLINEITLEEYFKLNPIK